MTSLASAFLYAAVRTPFGRFNGALAGVRPDDLAAALIESLLVKTPGLDPAAVEEVVWGNANGAGEEKRKVGRMATLLAGLPTGVPATTVGTDSEDSSSSTRRIRPHPTTFGSGRQGADPTQRVEVQIPALLAEARGRSASPTNQRSARRPAADRRPRPDGTENAAPWTVRSRGARYAGVAISS
jgi:hypothetical protein